MKNEITPHLVRRILDALQGTYPSIEFEELEKYMKTATLKFI